MLQNKIKCYKSAVLTDYTIAKSEENGLCVSKPEKDYCYKLLWVDEVIDITAVAVSVFFVFRAIFSQDFNSYYAFFFLNFFANFSLIIIDNCLAF